MLEGVMTRTLLICLMALLAAMYGIAWFAPAIGLVYSDGAALMMATAHKGDALPPFFPALLALFAVVSKQAWWLKLVPLAATLLWLGATRRLLIRMGASEECAMLLSVLTAASPCVLYLATGLFPEPLFALLVTIALLMLLDERPLAAGICAGLATVTVSAGTALILAGLFTLVATRRLRAATLFLCASGLFAVPWLGWTLAASGFPAARLHLSELGVLLGKNAMWLAASPFTLLTGYASLYPGLLTAVALFIVLVRRRQLLPDLFVGFYSLFLLWRVEPPLHAFAAVLPMFLWMLWRVARTGRFATVAKASAILMLAPALWFGAVRISSAVKLGAVTAEAGTPDNWHEMEKLFGYIRANTPANAVILADLDPLFSFETGRPAVRGFDGDAFQKSYTTADALVTPDQLRAALIRDQVNYVALTPDRDLPESPSFHKSVAALERGGLLEPVTIPGISSDYRLLQVATVPLRQVR